MLERCDGEGCLKHSSIERIVVTTGYIEGTRIEVGKWEQREPGGGAWETEGGRKVGGRHIVIHFHLKLKLLFD